MIADSARQDLDHLIQVCQSVYQTDYVCPTYKGLRLEMMQSFEKLQRYGALPPPIDPKYDDINRMLKLLSRGDQEALVCMRYRGTRYYSYHRSRYQKTIDTVLLLEKGWKWRMSSTVRDEVQIGTVVKKTPRGLVVLRAHPGWVP